MKNTLRFLVIGTLLLPVLGYAGENLKINPRLNYSSDSQDGPLISGADMDKGAVAGKPNYIIMFGEG
jgi:hypothetical protein